MIQLAKPTRKDVVLQSSGKEIIVESSVNPKTGKRQFTVCQAWRPEDRLVHTGKGVWISEDDLPAVLKAITEVLSESSGKKWEIVVTE